MATLDQARAVAIIDLGFGDAGKGVATDYLARRRGATAVVRFNGGAQAGHHVVMRDGRHHCFSQFGAGTLHGETTSWLAADVAIHPPAMVAEASRLSALGIRGPFSRLLVHEECPVITPFHQSLGRLRELVRGVDRHGSCGIGFGETIADLRQNRASLHAKDLLDPRRARTLLEVLREYKREQLRELAAISFDDATYATELRYFGPEFDVESWLQQSCAVAKSMRILSDDDWHSELAMQRQIVFEGAQGLLLDENVGFYPFLTYSRCDASKALEIARRCGFGDEVAILGVTRAYAVRHGPGPLPSEWATPPSSVRELHNATGVWQGQLRYGALDLVLLRYACAHAAKLQPLDGLFVTHLDQVDGGWQWIRSYPSPPTSGQSSADTIENLPQPRFDDFAARRKLTEWLLQLRVDALPIGLASTRPGHVLAHKLMEELRVPSLFGSLGPRAADVEALAGCNG